MEPIGWQPDVPLAARKPRFRPDVQGLRAVAVVLVVAYHSVFRDSGGFAGVDVFFVLSGFVITGLLLRELDQTGRLSFRAFYARRVQRLLPALALVLLTVAIVAPLVQTPLGSLQVVASTGLATVFVGANAELFANGGGYFDVAAVTNPLLHMWTLAVEEQFYLVFPALLVLAWWLARRGRTSPRRLATIIVIAAAVTSLALSVFLTYWSGRPLGLGAVDRSFAFYSSPTRAWEFAAGALVALAEPWLRQRLLRWHAMAASALALAGLITTVLVVRDSQPFPGVIAILPVAATCGLLVAGTGPTTPVGAWLSHPRTVWVGDQSYSWYLWHWPLIVFFRALDPAGPAYLLALAGLAGLPLAWLTSRVVEAPFRRNRRIVGWRAVRLAAVCFAAPCLAFCGLALFDSHPPAVIRQLAWEARAHLDSTQPCIGDLPRTAMSAHCTWTVPDPRGTVMLVGDSNAGQFAEPVMRLARARGMDFMLATSGGCPFVPLSTVYLTVPHETSACDRFVRAWSAEIARTRPAVVVLASVTPNYVENYAVTMRPVDGSSGPSSSPRDKAALWRRALATMMFGWAARGVPTVVVNTVPQFGSFNLVQCPAYVAYRTPADCAVQAPTADLVKFETRSKAAEEAAVAKVPGATTLNLFDEICGRRSTCSTYQRGQFAYRDGVHLSVSFSEQLQPEIAAAVDRVIHGPSAK